MYETLFLCQKWLSPLFTQLTPTQLSRHHSMAPPLEPFPPIPAYPLSFPNFRASLYQRAFHTELQPGFLPLLHPCKSRSYLISLCFSIRHHEGWHVVSAQELVTITLITAGEALLELHIYVTSFSGPSPGAAAWLPDFEMEAQKGTHMWLTSGRGGHPNRTPIFLNAVKTGFLG